jgi:hypothetical protein
VLRLSMQCACRQLAGRPHHILLNLATRDLVPTTHSDDDDRGTHAPCSTMLPCHVSDLRFRAALCAGATATSMQELADVEDEDDEQVPERAIASAVRKLNQRLQTSMQTTLGKQAQRGLIARLQDATSLSAVGGHGAAGASQSVDQLPETWPDTSEPSAKRRK